MELPWKDANWRKQFTEKYAAQHKTLNDYLLHLYSQFEFDKPEFLPFEPRKISSPGGYDSPKCVAASLLSIVTQTGISLEWYGQEPDPTHITATSVTYKVIDQGVPIYYVSESLIRSVAATKMPEGIRFSEMKLFSPAFVFAFPKRFVREYFGRDFCYVFGAHIPGGKFRSTKLPGAPGILDESEVLGIFWHCYNNGDLELYSHPSKWNSFIDSKFGEYIDYTNADATTIMADQEFLDRVSALVLKLLLVIPAREGLVTQGTLLRKASQKKGKRRSELWNANVIGKYYKIVREHPPGGTHASPEFHWRRGFWNWQVIGKKEDFVPIASLPTIPAPDEPSGKKIDWEHVDAMTKAKFLASHRHNWVDGVWVGELPNQPES